MSVKLKTHTSLDGTFSLTPTPSDQIERPFCKQSILGGLILSPRDDRRIYNRLQPPKICAASWDLTGETCTEAIRLSQLYHDDHILVINSVKVKTFRQQNILTCAVWYFLVQFLARRQIITVTSFGSSISWYKSRYNNAFTFLSLAIHFYNSILYYSKITSVSVLAMRKSTTQVYFINVVVLLLPMREQIFFSLNRHKSDFSIPVQPSEN